MSSPKMTRILGFLACADAGGGTTSPINAKNTATARACFTMYIIKLPLALNSWEQKQWGEILHGKVRRTPYTYPNTVPRRRETNLSKMTASCSSRPQCGVHETPPGI